MNSKTIPKITKQKVRASKPTKNIKWNHKKYSVDKKRGERRKGEQRMNGINTKPVPWLWNYT